MRGAQVLFDSVWSLMYQKSLASDRTDLSEGACGCVGGLS